MSDMSLPSLSLVPLGHAGGPPHLPLMGPLPPVAVPFTWPTPMTGGFAAPNALVNPEPCEIEGPNGKISRGRLVAFVAEAGLISLN
ncbi:MAG: hypothetical protein H7242_20315, partial [Microbacteriaceae bacterium]|nr:hypothetical protein [Burkholderiaceae bacterium]